MPHLYERLIKETGLNPHQIEMRAGMGKGAIDKGIKKQSPVRPDTLRKIQEAFPEFDLGEVNPTGRYFKLPAFLQAHIITIVRSAVASALPSAADELIKLQQLRKDEVISESEFQTLKSAVIAKYK